MPSIRRGEHTVERIAAAAAFIGELGILLGVISPIIVSMRRIRQGMKCQLRSEMLRIYYHNRETERIRQYEYENFLLLLGAYKSLKGNSFIDKIAKEVQSWEVVT